MGEWVPVGIYNTTTTTTTTSKQNSLKSSLTRGYVVVQSV